MNYPAAIAARYLYNTPLPLSACGEGWLKAGVRRKSKQSFEE
jgi:hypothetical protein